MTNAFVEQGPTLLAKGYWPLPIRQGEKRPALQRWQKARATPGVFERFPRHGVGVICGVGPVPIAGIDIDVSHPQICAKLIAYCQEHFGMGCERVGAAPRILLVYRASQAGWTKGNSIAFFDPTDPLKLNGKDNEQRIEVLGLGQQFVAYHIHPDTGQPYQWVDVWGGLDQVAAADLPEITSEQINGLMVYMAKLVRETPGLSIRNAPESSVHTQGGSEDDDLASFKAKVNMPFEEAVEWVGYLDNGRGDAGAGGDDYDTWLHVGMALHHEYADTEHRDAALELWKSYGARSSKDRPSEYDYKWKSFGGGHNQTTLRWLLKIANIAKQEHMLDEKRELLDRMKTMIREEKDSLKLGTEVAKKLRGLMPADTLIQNEIVSAFQKHMLSVAETRMPIAQIRDLLIGSKAPRVLAKRPMTEFGNADRMLDRYAEGLMYVPEIERWYIWTGYYWRQAVTVEIAHLAKEVIRDLYKEAADIAEDQRAEFFEFCSISQRAYMVANMVTLASSDPRVVVPAAELDKHPHLLGVANGVVDLRNGKLLPPDKEYHITLNTGCPYDAHAQAPLFEQTLLDVFSGSKEEVDFFLRCIGYALQGNPTQDVMFIPFGDGSNGKSTVFGVAQAVFGGYALSADPASFVSAGVGLQNAGGPREDLVRMRGARLVYVNEPDENSELREGMVKAMTGGDAITARGVNAKNSLQFMPTWTIVMPTNHKPIIKGTDNGIWRRIVTMPFLRNFESDPTVKKDAGRREKLMAEREGILAMFVRGGLEYARLGLALPDSIRASRDQYREDMDLLAEWLEVCCEVGEDFKEQSTRLWTSWEQFAKNRGLQHFIKSSAALGRRMEQKFPAKKGTGGSRYRMGLRLKADFPGENP